MSRASNLGHLGEEIAVKYLQDKGYHIRHCNWGLHKGYELDIVAMHNGDIVVVEVKTRSSDIFKRPEEAVNAQKVKRICMATHRYLRYFNLLVNVRFDIIAIVYHSAENYEINHIENAFTMPLNTRGGYSKWF